MSDLAEPFPNRRRRRLLASVAGLALVASGALGGAMIAYTNPARAAAVVTSDLQAQAVPSFSPIVERVKPAVVSVRVLIDNLADNGSEVSHELDKLPPQLKELFKRLEQNGGAQPRQAPRQGMAQGSGFFVSADGYVVTNNHVVEHGKVVTVTTEDGKVLEAKVIGTDPKTDLALLKVLAPGDYPYVSLARDTPKVGDWVVAIGNPFGLGGTVTSGIVSARGRDIGNGPYDDFLQIDAPINKGNSGGPTFNLKGEVVGVNTAIYSPSGGSVGLAFAIPADTVSTVVAALQQGGAVQRGYLGVQIQPVTRDIADSLGLDDASGALVDSALPGTPAADAGVKSGDVITKLNGQPVKDDRDLTRRVGALKPGDKAEIAVLRSGKELALNVALAPLKTEKVAEVIAEPHGGASVLGVLLAPAKPSHANSSHAKSSNGAAEQGVTIARVDPNGPAASKGLSKGDVILEVAGRSVTQPAEVKAGIASAAQDGKKAVLLKIKTAQGALFMAFPLPKA
ncbi:serine protease Do [Bosea sp. OK403]|uniref:Do family serine endopeptidase n=1 Tax=Bosea sp. OK403 TaxID=1855286 RepID=UPI0008E36801|nr:Do family serine endopeptidase [Bosea sp. OK403]SFI00427.1 serine protease Do [Bosea sp. OK403]